MTNLYYRSNKVIFPGFFLLALLLCSCLDLQAEELSSQPTLDKWVSITLDNDLFISSDSGYTNGLYITFFAGSYNKELKPALLTRPLQWSMADQPFVYQYNATTVGQVMITPEDITINTPQPNDVPYSGLLFVQQTNIKVYDSHSDKVSTTLGIVGPSSGADESQKMVHRLIGADAPQGWEYQLNDEIVFQLSRGRIWRTWRSSTNTSDVLVGSDAKIGTLESSLTVGAMFRYGRNIEDSYSTAILTDDRTINPVNINGGWYVYMGLSTAYVANVIYLDGNTFKDSPSVDYDREQIDVHMGFTYGWEDISVSVALNNIDWLSSKDKQTDLREYGSITLLWRR